MKKPSSRRTDRRPINHIHCLAGAIRLLVIAACYAWPASVSLAITSTWQVDGSGADWFIDAPWTNGIPNAPGDIAELNIAGISEVSAGLSEDATVGELRLLGNASTNLSGAGMLIFDNPGPNPAFLAAGTMRVGVVFDVGSPLGVVPGEELLLAVTQRATFVPSGGFAPGGSTVRKTAAGLLLLNTASPEWTGALNIDGGEVQVASGDALVATTAVQVGPAGTLSLLTDANIPNVVLDGGTLQTPLGARREFFDLRGDIALQGQSRIQVGEQDGLNIFGEVSGPGGLDLSWRDDPAVPAGPFNFALIQLFSPTSYEGPTRIGPNVSLELRSGATLGATTGGTFVERGGRLVLSGGGGGEAINVDRATIIFDESATPYTHAIHLRSGNLDGGDDITAVVAAPVTYTEGALLGSESSATNLVVAGGISGTGSLVIQNEVEVQSAIQARGHLYIRNRAGATLSGPLNIAGDVLFNWSSLTVTGDLEADQTRFRIAPNFVTADASLFVASSNTIGSAQLDPRGADRETTFERSSIATGEGATLTIANDLNFLGGRLRGQILGVPVLTKKQRAIGVLDTIAGSAFERADVEAGELLIRGDVGQAPPAVHLGMGDTARLKLENVGVYSGDIHLNDAKGFGAEPALTLRGDTLFNGDLFLGARGASVGVDGGFPRPTTNGFGPDAVIHGGDLWLQNRAAIRIRSGAHTYTGDTHIAAEGVILIDQGRLNSTAAVVGHGRIFSSGGRGELVLDNSGSQAHNDRIPDATPVQGGGMLLRLIGREGVTVNETLGELRLDRGVTDLVVQQGAGSATGETTLTLGRLVRQPGAAVNFRPADARSTIRLTEEPTLDDGLIGGWALAGEGDFATYESGVVVAYADVHTYQSNLLTATASDNVSLSPTAPVTLASDKRINALRLERNQVDLGGQTLTIESGGLLSRQFGASIAGGQLTAGTEAGAELLISGSVRIDADIVDNAEGAVELTHSVNTSLSDAVLILAGTNTYSGPTTVNGGGRLEIVSETALPTGGDIVFNGGQLRLDFNAAAPLRVGEVVMREGGAIQSLSAFDPQLRPESIIVESATVTVDIVGEGPILKRGPGSAFFGASNGNVLTGHSGPITVEEGLLTLEGIGAAPVDDSHAITVLEGGRLLIEFFDTSTERKYRLDGGILEINRSDLPTGVLEILPAGGTLRGNSSFLAAGSLIVVGEGRLTVDGRLGTGSISQFRRLDFDADLSQFTGDLLITGGNVDIGLSNLNYEGDIEVTAANLTLSTNNPFGESLITVLPEGQMTIVENLFANLRLDGGVLRTQFRNGLPSPTVSGDLAIGGHAYLFMDAPFDGATFRPTIDARTVLEQGSSLTISQAPEATSQFEDGLLRGQISFNGDLIVAGAATLVSYDSVVAINSVIQTGAPVSVLNLEGNDTFNLNVAVQLNRGESLEVRIDGETKPLSVGGLGNNSVTGDGSLINSLVLGVAATLGPGLTGDPAGRIAIAGDVTMQRSVIYRWDIAASNGEPGVDWDLLQVEGDLIFDVLEGQNWQFAATFLPGFAALEPGAFAGGRWLIASADNITGFDPGQVTLQIDSPNGLPSGLTADDFRLLRKGGDLFLVTVPEPASVASLLLLMLITAFRPTRD